MQEQTTPITSAVVKATPPVAVTFMDAILGIPLASWVQFATLIYVTLQTYFLVRDRLRKRKEQQGGQT